MTRRSLWSGDRSSGGVLKTREYEDKDDDGGELGCGSGQTADEEADSLHPRRHNASKKQVVLRNGAMLT